MNYRYRALYNFDTGSLTVPCNFAIDSTTSDVWWLADNVTSIRRLLRPRLNILRDFAATEARGNAPTLHVHRISRHCRASQNTLTLWFVRTGATDCLERLVPEMTCWVSVESSNGTFNSAHSLTPLSSTYNHINSLASLVLFAVFCLEMHAFKHLIV